MPRPAARPPDVLVVGAGLAGLAAALDLAGAGRRVLVLDAADAVGGRIRTEVRNGFRLDRGFQVFNPAYPQARRMLDLPALGLRPFLAEAEIYWGGRRHLVADPRRHPDALRETLRAPLGPRSGTVRLGARAGYDAVAPPGWLRAETETTVAEALDALPAALVERLVRPFLAGVFLERDLATSSRFFHLVLRTLVRGTPAVPAAGMGEIPAQLARRLPPDALRLHAPVSVLTDEGALLEDGTELPAAKVVVATDAPTATRLLPLGPPPRMNSVTTMYHAAATPPSTRPALVLDGESVDTGFGPLVNTVVLSAAAPSYAPAGAALVSTSLLGVHVGPAVERAVRARLAVLYGVDTAGWEHLATYPVADALPSMAPPLQFRPPVRVGPGRYVCGDYRDTASQQGALVSGRRAARAVLADSPG